MRKYSNHGMSGTSTYNIWLGMVSRCTNPKNVAYKNYGGRGILVCERWLSFENFLSDMGVRPNRKTLDRIDNNGPYSPMNCRWADRVTQGRNKRNNRNLTVDGVCAPMSEWADRYGLSAGTIWQRIKKGWSHERAVKTPIVQNRKGLPRGYSWGHPDKNKGLHRRYGSLLPSQVEDIANHPSGYGSGRALSKLYGVSEALISKIRTDRIRSAQEGLTITHFDNPAFEGRE